MISNVKKLIVKHNNKVVGYLQELEGGKIGFQYDEEWVKSGFSISPISLPLNNNVYTSNSPYFDGLYGVFNDSLPDGWGELLVRRMLSKKGVNFDKLSPLTRLTLISGNGLGSLTYEPTQTVENDDLNYDLDELAKEIEKILDDSSEVIDLDKIFGLGGSSGGARPKAHLKINDEYWIVKFASIMDPKNIGELEYNANYLAKNCGIIVNEFKLFPSTRCSGYFGAKRFDRINNRNIHIISLSAVLETTHRIPNLDYTHLLQVIQKICINKNDLYEAYKRMCFNVLYQNKDDHGKNFAFLYNEELKGYELSPAYDITKTPNKFEHEMTVLGEGNPKEKDLLKLAKKMKLSIEKCQTIINDIKQVIN
jgi:serine/threonine-protein kinase HipA